MPTLEAQKQEHKAVHRRVAIQADNSGQLPTRIEMVRAGEWPDDSNKGHLEITRGDLYEMKANFDAGVGMPDGLNKLAIDFMHEDWAEAALWIGSLEVDGDILFGSDLEYTTKGREALTGGMFKCFSPSFYPRCLGSWHDPEDWSITATNVLVGGALTNIPFFKDLLPIMASRNSQEGEDDTLFVEADAKGAPMPTLDQVRVKAASDLTDEDKTLLEQNRTDLSDDELKKFNMEVQPVVPAPEVKPVAETQEQKEAAALQASVKSGESIVVKASDFQALQASVKASETQLTAYRTERVNASIDEHVKRGAIKADSAETWAKRVMADETVLEDLAALPANPMLASEIGSSAGAQASATEEVRTRATKLVADAKEAGQTLASYDATAKVLADDKELEKRYNEEVRGEA